MKEIFPNFQYKGDFIDGAFRERSNQKNFFPLRNPANFNDEFGKIYFDPEAIDESLDAACKAKVIWIDYNEKEKIQLFKSLIENLEKRSNEIALQISREIGKPIWESRDETQNTICRMQIFLNDSINMQHEYQSKELNLKNTNNTNENSIGMCRIKPRGVCVVLGHFNLPFENPISYIIPSMLQGNTVVFKPSKKAPGIGQILSECIQEANFPKGVFNMIQGGREISRRLAQDRDVDTVFYAGDYEFGNQIRKDTFEHTEKLLMLELGGKNPAIIFDDVDLDYAVSETLIGAYMTAGQRADSTSRIILTESIADEFIKKFHQAAKKIVIAHPANEDQEAFMGPLVDLKTMERYLKFQGIAVREGAECIMRGKRLKLGQEGYFVSPSIYLFKENATSTIKKSVYLQTEIFGPSVGIHIVHSADEAIQVANANNYALCASVFTNSESTYKKLWRELRYGVIHWNESTLRRNFNLPYAGIKYSSLAQPRMRSMIDYALYTVSSIETAAPKFNPANLPPGLKL